MGVYQRFDPSSIRIVGERLRPLDPAKVKVIKDSIQEREKAGFENPLINPITIRRLPSMGKGLPRQPVLVSGYHRLEAVLELKWKGVECHLVEEDDLHAQLTEIDENLCRGELSPAERKSHHIRRAEIWITLYPETGKGKAPGAGQGKGSKPRLDKRNNCVLPNSNENNDLATEPEPAPETYTTKAAKETGQSKRAVQQDIKDAKVLGDDTLGKITNTSLDKETEINALASNKLDNKEKAELVEKAAKGEKVSAKKTIKEKEEKAKPKPKAPAEKSDFTLQVKMADLVEKLVEIYSPGDPLNTGKTRAKLQQALNTVMNPYGFAVTLRKLPEAEAA